MQQKHVYLVILTIVLLSVIYNSWLYKQSISLFSNSNSNYPIRRYLAENVLPSKYEPAVRDFYGYKCQEKIR